MQYDNTTYDNARSSAAQLTDQELINEHIRYMEFDGSTTGGGLRRNVVDDPYWTMIKWEARQRGVERARFRPAICRRHHA
jgi:hypothetical protein